MTSDIEKAVVAAIAKQKQISNDIISPVSSLQELGVSSLDAITIVYEIEELFDVEVPNEELESLLTVKDIVDGISNLISSKG